MYCHNVLFIRRPYDYISLINHNPCFSLFFVHSFSTHSIAFITSTFSSFTFLYLSPYQITGLFQCTSSILPASFGANVVMAMYTSSLRGYRYISLAFMCGSVRSMQILPSSLFILSFHFAFHFPILLCFSCNSFFFSFKCNT